VEVLLHPVTEPEGGASHPFYSSFPSFSSSSSLFSSVLRELLLWHVVECFYIHTIDDSTVRQKKNERKVMYNLHFSLSTLKSNFKSLSKKSVPKIFIESFNKSFFSKIMSSTTINSPILQN
jgi:hypothetical protein